MQKCLGLLEKMNGCVDDLVLCWGQSNTDVGVFARKLYKMIDDGARILQSVLDFIFTKIASIRVDDVT